MILDPGENLLIVHRRLFERDHSRFFVGKIEDYEDGIARLSGYSFARDSNDGNYCRKHERHTRLFSIASGTLMIYCIPADVDIDRVKMVSGDMGLSLTDGASFTMNMSEWIHNYPTQ